MKKVEMPDGWTFVSKSKGRRPRKHLLRGKFDSQSASKAPVNRDSVASGIRRVESLSEEFKASECAKSLRTLLAKHAISLDSALCSGLSNLDPLVAVEPKRSELQLCVFLWVVQSVSSERQRVHLKACDPDFTATDTAILEHFGVSIIPVEEVDDSVATASFLFTPFLPWSVLATEYLGSTSPAVCVCQDLAGTKDSLEVSASHGTPLASESEKQKTEYEEQNQQIRKAVSNIEDFLSTYAAFDFPDCELHSCALLGLKVYIRRSKEG